MMSVEKKKDISVMYSLGIKKKTVRYAFILQGVLIGLSGIVIGLFVGVIISLIQHETGFVKINLTNLNLKRETNGSHYSCPQALS